MLSASFPSQPIPNINTHSSAPNYNITALKYALCIVILMYSEASPDNGKPHYFHSESRFTFDQPFS